MSKAKMKAKAGELQWVDVLKELAPSSGGRGSKGGGRCAKFVGVAQTGSATKARTKAGAATNRKKQPASQERTSIGPSMSRAAASTMDPWTDLTHTQNGPELSTHYVGDTRGSATPLGTAYAVEVDVPEHMSGSHLLYGDMAMPLTSSFDDRDVLEFADAGREVSSSRARRWAEHLPSAAPGCYSQLPDASVLDYASSPGSPYNNDEEQTVERRDTEGISPPLASISDFVAAPYETPHVAFRTGSPSMSASESELSSAPSYLRTPSPFHETCRPMAVCDNRDSDSTDLSISGDLHQPAGATDQHRPSMGPYSRNFIPMCRTVRSHQPYGLRKRLTTRTEPKRRPRLTLGAIRMIVNHLPGN